MPGGCDSPPPATRPGAAPCCGRCPRPRGSGRRPSGARRSRQREHEGAALPNLAVNPDAAAMELDEALRQRQPKASPLALLLARGGLLELLEDPRLVLRSDP